MIFKTAYDTAACSGFVMKKTVDAVQAAVIHGQLRQVDNTSVFVVQGGSSVADAVPAFAHPVLFTDSYDQVNVAVDVRSFGSWSNQQHDFIVRNEAECTLAIYRGKLNQIWVKDRPQILRDISPLPMAAFAAWISEAVGRRFALDPREQFELAILAAIFYNGLFSDDATLEDREKLRITGAVARATRAKAEDVLTILDQLETLPQNVFGFCEAAPRIIKSVRLSELNAGLLMAVLGGTWFGTNAKENVAVALEHPPTWLAILISALTERSYKNSGITKVIERIGNRTGGDDFVRAIKNAVAIAVDA